MINYYSILGVGQNASDEEIKDAYRKLCLKYHPDRSKLPNAAEMFNSIQEAYEFLSDATNRRILDEYLLDQQKQAQQEYQYQAQQSAYQEQPTHEYQYETEKSSKPNQKEFSDEKDPSRKLIIGFAIFMGVAVIAVLIINARTIFNGILKPDVVKMLCRLIVLLAIIIFVKLIIPYITNKIKTLFN